jgi:hypothetical protein
VNGAASVLGLREASALPTDYEDPDLALPGNQNAQNWRRLTQSPADLSPLTQSRMQDLALHLYDRNPLGKRILELTKDFVVGEGIEVDSSDEAVKEEIDRFWSDGQNDMPARCHAITMELGLYGEQGLTAFVNESSGAVRVTSIDPRNIKSVIPAPGNPDIAFAICIQGSVGQDDRYLKVIREDDDPTSATYGELIGATPGETFKLGERTVEFYQPPGLPGGSRLAGCCFVAVNKVQAALRGRSDLLPIADFLDLYDRLVFDEAERMSFLRAFVWDVTVKGNADAADLQRRAAEAGVPPPGSVKFHNESEIWQAISPSLGAQDSQTTADLILSLIATGAGLPKTWLSGTLDVNRATAQELDQPAIKHLGTRQEVVITFLRRVVRFALDTAARAGAIKRPADGEQWDFTISAPEMSNRDMGKAASALQTTVQALGMADLNGWIDDETAQQAVVLGLGQLGLEVNLEEMQKRIEEQKAEDAKNDLYEYPPYLGVGARPGPEPLAAAQDEQQGRAPARNGRATAPRQNGAA